jgi:transposase
MNYVGVDYHKKYSHVTVVNEKGQVIRSQRLPNTSESFKGYFQDLGGPNHAVLETSGTWGVMFDLLEELEEIESVTLAHAHKVRVIAEAKIKTDKIDAGVLAQMLRTNWIPAVYIPGKPTRAYREMIRQRVFLVRMRTRVKNRIHVLLDRLHIPMPAVSDLFGKRGTQYLKKLVLPEIDGTILRQDLELLDLLNKLLQEAEREIDKLLQADPRVQLLRSIPGLGPIFAAVVALEIDDIERFPSPAKLAAYCGLVPSTYSSGGKVFHGRLLPWCNKWLRWALIEGAWAAMRTSPYCRAHFAALQRRKGQKAAIISLARRLSEIIWHVWKEKRAYEERPVSKMRRKCEIAFSPAALTAN